LIFNMSVNKVAFLNALRTKLTIWTVTIVVRCRKIKQNALGVVTLILLHLLKFSHVCALNISVSMNVVR